jgi:hypothetical protein
MRKHCLLLRFFALPCAVLLSSLSHCSFASAQDTPAPAAVTPAAPTPTVEVADSLPDSPDAVLSDSSSLQQPQTARAQTTAAPPVHEDKQQKRIFYILPNFRSVTAGTKLPPQTVKDKFTTASEDSFDYSSFLLAGLVAVYSYGTNATPEFHSGGAAYGRYYWHSFVDQTSENYLVEFILPVITHEDTRYYSLGSGGFGKRALYSLTRPFITRSDSGKKTFNSSEIFGAGISAGISNLYYPTPERTASNTLDKWGQSVGIDMAGFFVKEFSTDIYHVLFHGKADSP